MTQRAIECWRKQLWDNRELVIVDDLECLALPYGIFESSIRYFRLPGRMTIGAKRNYACSLSQGDLIIHWDSDDICMPGRITDQVNRLVESGKYVTSYSGLIFSDGVNWWKNTNWPGGYGSTLCYRRAWWEKHQFPDMQSGEDWHFVSAAMRANEFVSADAGEFMVAVNHDGQTAKRLVGAGWIPIDKPTVFAAPTVGIIPTRI